MRHERQSATDAQREIAAHCTELADQTSRVTGHTPQVTAFCERRASRRGVVFGGHLATGNCRKLGVYSGLRCGEWVTNREPTIQYSLLWRVITRNSSKVASFDTEDEVCSIEHFVLAVALRFTA